MLSTFHGSGMVNKMRRSRAAAGGVEKIQKPAVIEDYNMHMGGVDKSKYIPTCMSRPILHHLCLPF